MTDDLIFEPGNPGKYFCDFIQRRGFRILEVLAFTGLSTVVKVVRPKEHPLGATECVVKGFFGYYTASRHCGINKSAYGYLWYKHFANYEYEYWLNQFRNEAQILMTLSEKWVNVYSVDLNSVIPFYEMEYVSGGSLNTLVESRWPATFEFEEVLNFTRDVLSALSELHSIGYIHRDVTPDNIMNRSSKWILTDLGYGRFLESREQPSRKPPMVYWPPEYADSFHKVSAAADLYSTATIAFQLLTGEVPRYGSVIRGLVEVPASFRKFLEMSLAIMPDARLQTAAECLDLISSS